MSENHNVNKYNNIKRKLIIAKTIKEDAEEILVESSPNLTKMSENIHFIFPSHGIQSIKNSCFNSKMRFC